MNISTQVNQIDAPTSEEMSSLRSPIDKSSPWGIWRIINRVITLLNKQSRIINQMAREINRLGDRKSIGLDMYPFKIYNAPDNFQLNPESSSNWNTFNVRGGYVMTQIIATSSYVNGTDLMHKNAYQSTFPSPITVGQYIIPQGTSQYWFWVEQSGSQTYVNGTSSYYLRSGPNPTGSSTYNPNPWTSFPQTSTNGSGSSTGSYNRWIIGYVDTLSSMSVNQAFVRQLQVGDILTTGGGSLPSFTASICQLNGPPLIYELYGYQVTTSIA